MAYKASAYFKGNARKATPSGFHAGATATISHTHVFDKEAVAATDVLELIMIPAGARPVSCTFSSENLPAGNTTLGFMSGTPGDPSDARTLGTEIAAAVAHAATDTSLTLAALSAAAFQPSDVDRSIGFKPSVDTGAVAANKKLHIRVTLQF